MGDAITWLPVLGNGTCRLYEINNYNGSNTAAATYLTTMPKDCYGIAYLNGLLELTGMDFGSNCYYYDYNIADNKLVASHKILVQRFEFGDKVESKDALHLPFGMAVALLEDPQGKINISLPVHGDMSDPEFEYFHLIGQVARNFFMKLVTKPFSFLASAIGSESGEEE